MNKYLIAILTALTLTTVTPALADKFHNPDGSDGCVSVEVLKTRAAMIKAMTPDAFVTDVLETKEGMGKQLLAGINTVFYDEKKDQIHPEYVLFLSGSDGKGGHEALIPVSEDGQTFCEYIKMDSDETLKLDLILKTVGANAVPQPELGPTN